MTEPIVLTPIGVVGGGGPQIVEDHWGAVVSRLVLDPEVLDQAATDGLSEFSHIEVVFFFHQETRVRRGAAHPRGNPACFAQPGSHGNVPSMTGLYSRARPRPGRR